MVFPPGHFEQVTRRRPRRRGERLAVRLAVVVTLILVGLVVFSLTTHQRKTGGGCVDFNYSTMIGGAEMYKCGTQARTLCATPAGGKSIDGDYLSELVAACRKAGLPTGS
jgi:hypothetical protein